MVNQLEGLLPVSRNGPTTRCPGYPGAGTRTILSETESEVGDEEEIVIVSDEVVLNLFFGCIT